MSHEEIRSPIPTTSASGASWPTSTTSCATSTWPAVAHPRAASGSGPELVLLHGTGGHLEAYARDIAGLAADFRVTAYDMVGHGWSDLPDRPYTIDVLSDHLVG